MSAISKLLVTVGLLSLFHAAYSAYEHSSLALQLHTNTSLPVDITIETLGSLLLVCLGLVIGADPLRPISWSSWASNIEKEGGGSNPFRTLEDRVNFMDIRQKRKEFADWVRQGGSVELKK